MGIIIPETRWAVSVRQNNKILRLIVASSIRMNVELFSAVVGLLETNRPRLRTLPPPHSYGNQRLQRQFDGLLMMGILMPETCWAVSVRQSNKIVRLIVASSWVFYLSLTCQLDAWLSFHLLVDLWRHTDVCNNVYRESIFIFDNFFPETSSLAVILSAEFTIIFLSS